MSILPVLDLMNGQIVRGIAGRREEYRPIVSRLVASAEPVAIANAFRDQFGFDEFYLADLDAIQGRSPAELVYKNLQWKEGFRLWIDGGISSALSPSLGTALLYRPDTIVVGLESILGPDALAGVLRVVNPHRVVFSLDLKGGHPVGRIAAWNTDDPWMIAVQSVKLGIERLIVLDLLHVGVGGGIGTEELCKRLKQAYPELQLTAGGGVRDIEDVKRLTSIGVDRVLVASALHDGRITPKDVRDLRA